MIHGGSKLKHVFPGNGEGGRWEDGGEEQARGLVPGIA